MPKSVKVVKLNEPQPEIKQEEEPQEIQEERKEIEQVVEVIQEQDETKDDDLNSEDLDHLVKEYTKQQKLKKQQSEPKSECQHCGKSMSSKSLKYTHQKNCKMDPKNRPPSPTPPPSLQPLSTPEPNLRPKPKSRPPRKTIIKQKMVEQEEVPYEIQKTDDHDVKEPLTTSYIKLMELQRSAKVQQTKQRMKNLASQAF
jgi:hypothetical protein